MYLTFYLQWRVSPCCLHSKCTVSQHRTIRPAKTRKCHRIYVFSYESEKKHACNHLYIHSVYMYIYGNLIIRVISMFVWETLAMIQVVSCIRYPMYVSKVVQSSSLYLCWSCCLFQCHIWDIDYVMDDNDILDIITRSSNIRLVHSFAPLTRHILLSLIHISDMPLASIKYLLHMVCKHENNVYITIFPTWCNVKNCVSICLPCIWGLLQRFCWNNYAL